MAQVFANLPVTAAPPLFADRRAAGRLLAARLRRALPAPGGQQAGGEAGEKPAGACPAATGPLVLALPRGGVPVAREVANVLAAPLDVLVTRKIGYPRQPELGVGAIAEGGEPVYDDEFLRRLGLSRGDLEPVVARERAELDRRVRVYRGGRPPPGVAGRLVILVDDGLATGVTARAALRSLRSRSAGQTVLAIPVAAPSSAAAMLREAEAVVTLALPETFRAVGEWYVSFGQLTDSDVLELLDRGGEAG
jgi:putative phosphoribosyl transferase